MRLQANIKPRRDGKVIFSSPSGVVYTFEADKDGFLVSDVKDPSDARAALKTGNFEPVEESDFARAQEMIAPELDEDEVQVPEVDADAPAPMPLEAKTPPARFKGGRKAK